MKLLASVTISFVAGLLVLAGSASAANPNSVTANNTITPASGPLYKEVARPVNTVTSAVLTPGPGVTQVDGLMESKVTVTKELKFVPDPTMPDCTLSNANVPPDTAKSQCPDSIVGNGESLLYLAQQVLTPINDPVLTVFNGVPHNGNPVLLIHGYSASTNAGIEFTSELSNGLMDVHIPRLTADSSSPTFSIRVPGEIGTDPDYAQATCKTGSYESSDTFTYGDRDASGTVSNTSELSTQPQTQACTGLDGKAKFAGLKIKAPKSAKSGRKATFQVTIKNTGTASAKNVKIAASGAGKGSLSVGTVKPETSKTVKVKAKVTGKKGRKVTVKFKATGTASATGKTKVKIG